MDSYRPIDCDEVVKNLNDDKSLVALANKQRLQLSYYPSQSNFQVYAFLVITSDDSPGYKVVEGANHEEGYIGGAICAEHAALSRLRFFKKPVIHLLVVTTDSSQAISPGMLCREFLNSAADPSTNCVIGNGDDTIAIRCTIGDLFPYPYPYRYQMRRDISDYAKNFSQPKSLSFIKWNERQMELYRAARIACQGDSKTEVHPIQFGAAVLLADGSIERAHILKGLEYGCTACPVVQLLGALQAKRFPQFCSPCTIGTVDTEDTGDNAIKTGIEKEFKVEALVMVDQFGVTHAPFASARALLTEHGYENTQILVHNEKGDACVCLASDLCPPPPGGGPGEMLTHDEFLKNK